MLQGSSSAYCHLWSWMQNCSYSATVQITLYILFLDPRNDRHQYQLFLLTNIAPSN